MKKILKIIIIIGIVITSITIVAKYNFSSLNSYAIGFSLSSILTLLFREERY